MNSPKTAYKTGASTSQPSERVPYSSTDHLGCQGLRIRFSKFLVEPDRIELSTTPCKGVVIPFNYGPIEPSWFAYQAQIILAQIIWDVKGWRADHKEKLATP